MLKNIKLHRIAPDYNFDFTTAEAALKEGKFIECSASQEESIGWLEPRGEEHGPLLESVGGHWIAKLMFESKILPGSVVAEEVKKRVIAMEATSGRKPGKKEKKEITEDVRNDLLAKAFTRKSAALIWLDPSTRMLVIEASTQTRADIILTELVKVLAGFSATPIQSQTSPEGAMAVWLDTQEVPPAFTADRDCVLQSSDESKATVKYAKHALDIDEIRGHIATGKRPVQLAMTWNSRVSFVLTDTFAIKGLSFLDVVTDSKTENGFDADAAITTGELSKLIPDLIEALGGEMVPA